MSKAREASQAESSNGHEDAEAELGIGNNTDTDRHWVQTLTQGARMLCRLALGEKEGCTALEECKEAKTMIEKARSRLDANDKELVGGIQLAEGIWHFVMAHIGEKA